MEIRKWTTVDVHYSDTEENLAKKERKYLERIGYELQQTDDTNNVGDAVCCDQYIKSGRTRVRRQF